MHAWVLCNFWFMSKYTWLDFQIANNIQNNKLMNSKNPNNMQNNIFLDYWGKQYKTSVSKIQYPKQYSKFYNIVLGLK